MFVSRFYSTSPTNSSKEQWILGQVSGSVTVHESLECCLVGRPFQNLYSIHHNGLNKESVFDSSHVMHYSRHLFMWQFPSVTQLILMNA